jgi:tRNA modification GTPase
MNTDTITAIATAPGRGGIGVIRLSGSQALTIGRKLTGRALQPRYATFASFSNAQGESLDTGLALYFPGPTSFTGEDVVELQGHGGPVILDIILRETLLLGARMAQPGEFSQRAFLNDKIDLAQAEAIADLINSTTAKAALNASHSLQGEFSNTISTLVQQVTDLRVYVEAAIDFPEEEVDFLADGKVIERVKILLTQFDAVHSAAKQGSLIREGMKLVIAGKPNAGKSSLLNALSGQDTAIVTDIEGTTRDVLKEQIEIDGVPLFLVDTAGLRDSENLIEQEGIRRAMVEVQSADHILLVLDASIQPLKSLDIDDLMVMHGLPATTETPVTIVLNKSDLICEDPAPPVITEKPGISLSAKTGEGIDLLRTHLKKAMGYNDNSDSKFSARRRHLQALQNARSSLLNGLDQLQNNGAGELLAEDLRQCQNSLGEITGKVSSDELLGEIFSSFCIGK